MAGARRSGDWRSLTAPVAFLLAVTIAVLLVRSALTDQKGAAPVRETRPAATQPAGTTTPRPRPRRRYMTVRAGDTFSTIATRAGITVDELERLNPHVKSTALFIGQ